MQFVSERAVGRCDSTGVSVGALEILQLRGFDKQMFVSEQKSVLRYQKRKDFMLGKKIHCRLL